MAVTFAGQNFLFAKGIIPGGADMAVLTGTAIDQISARSGDWQRFTSSFILDQVTWSNLLASAPIVSLAAIAAEEGHETNAGWAVDQTELDLVGGHIQLTCNLAVRGVGSLIRLSYQVTAFGHITGTA
ncbi:hypothetical protein [Streptomyces puniciscabiei]|uniref:hypothetical protein n=1 Tax=Streptomyces puniciscabiei TaxID=164348 RepID=UPI00332A9CA6